MRGPFAGLAQLRPKASAAPIVAACAKSNRRVVDPCMCLHLDTGGLCSAYFIRLFQLTQNAHKWRSTGGRGGKSKSSTPPLRIFDTVSQVRRGASVKTASAAACSVPASNVRGEQALSMIWRIYRPHRSGSSWQVARKRDAQFVWLWRSPVAFFEAPLLLIQKDLRRRPPCSLVVLRWGWPLLQAR